ncbi:MAG: DUF3429 family protein [Alphaproteobacteria bacterium]|nr:DUF3429 family protein [Alphaproteobacteria bacterium]
MTPERSPIPTAALWLGLTGLIPFYASAFAAAGPDAIAPWGVLSFAIYAAVILSFLGGARWGLELARAPDAPSTARLVMSVLPSIAGWALAAGALGAAVATGGTGGLGVPGLAGGFAALFAAQYVWDQSAPRVSAAPVWYPRLRQILTSGVIVACIVLPFAQVLGRP